MAKQQKERLERVTSPIGIARYPHIDKPDEYKGVAKYKVNLVLDGDDAFIESLKAKAEAAFEAAKQALVDAIKGGELKGKKLAEAKAEVEAMAVQYPFEPEYDDEGEETGRVIIKAASKATYEDKDGNVKQRKLPVFDSLGQKLEQCPPVWGGSEVRLSLDVFPYHMVANHIAGISLRLAGVQIVTLRTGGGATAEDLGFGAVDGGFAAGGAVNEGAAADADADVGGDDEEF